MRRLEVLNPIKHSQQNTMKFSIIATSIIAISAAPSYDKEDATAAVETASYEKAAPVVAAVKSESYAPPTTYVESEVHSADEVATVKSESYAPPTTYGENRVLPADEVAAVKSESYAEVAYVAKTPAECDGEILTIVEDGDSLDSIAQKYELDLEKLIAANPQFSENIDLIYPSDQVCVAEACGGGYKPYTAPAPAVNETLETNSTSVAVGEPEPFFDDNKDAFGLLGSSASTSTVSILLAFVAGSAVLLF
jgi:LysM repeat protein